MLIPFFRLFPPLAVALLLLGAGGVAGDALMPTVPVKQEPSDTLWRAYPVRTIDALGPLAPEPSLDAYGGRLDESGTRTGFFHAQKVGDRWWLVDPDGHLFLHVGVVSVTPGADTAPGWAGRATGLLRASGFNGVGAWSATALLRAVPQPLVYTVLGQTGAPGGVRGGFLTAFGASLGVTRPGIGHTDFHHGCLPVFHPQFAAFCDRFARPLAALKDDPYLLGYFSDNELPLPRLDQDLVGDPRDPALASSRVAAHAWLDARKGRPATLADVTAADRDAWAGFVFDRYLTVTTAAIRRYDPHHLCLGPRFYGRATSTASVFRAAGRYLDVIAVNDYGVWDPAGEKTTRWTAWSGRPVLITEFYAKGMDAGLANTSGAGWTVPTQADRGLFYQTFALGLLQSKTCVGWHWFKYADNDPASPAPDPSNRDANKGLVTIRGVSYAPLLDRMRALNARVYAAADRLSAFPLPARGGSPPAAKKGLTNPPLPPENNTSSKT